MESVIDERYRLLLIEHYLENNKELSISGGIGKLTFSCPFCGPLGRSEAKRKHRKAALLWNSVQHSWVFYCAKKGSVECMNGKSFSNLISALNPDLGEAYRRERWHSGTTGKGHNCKAPERLAGISTGLMGPAGPEVPLIDPPSGDAYLCFVPVAGQFGRHQRHCASPETAAICRTDPATE